MKARVVALFACSWLVAACSSGGSGSTAGGSRDGGVRDGSVSGGGVSGGGVSGGGVGGGGGGGSCVNIAGTYAGVESISTNSCRITPHVVSPSPTLTFVQVAGSCRFTMTNSFFANVSYAGSIDPKTNTASWTPTPAAYSENNGYTSITKVSVKITPAAASTPTTLDGSFAWSWARSQGGATVCSGSTTLAGYARQ